MLFNKFYHSIIIENIFTILINQSIKYLTNYIKLKIN